MPIASIATLAYHRPMKKIKTRVPTLQSTRAPAPGSPRSLLIIKCDDAKWDRASVKFGQMQKVGTHQRGYPGVLPPPDWTAWNPPTIPFRKAAVEVESHTRATNRWDDPAGLVETLRIDDCQTDRELLVGIYYPDRGVELPGQRRYLHGSRVAATVTSQGAKVTSITNHVTTGNRVGNVTRITSPPTSRSLV